MEEMLLRSDVGRLKQSFYGSVWTDWLAPQSITRLNIGQQQVNQVETGK
jgi:hypothetical protein